MVSSGSRTIWEGFEDIESHTHAWNCYPLYLLQRYVLGIEPAVPGFQKIKIAPFFPAQLQKIEGAVQTPFGALILTGSFSEQAVQFIIEVPQNIVAEFQYKELRKELSSGLHTFTIASNS